MTTDTQDHITNPEGEVTKAEVNLAAERVTVAYSPDVRLDTLRDSVLVAGCGLVREIDAEAELEDTSAQERLWGSTYIACGKRTSPAQPTEDAKMQIVR